MLEKLTIRNFQKHKKLEIDFEPTITTIVGRTDSGKSSILRSLRWICTNKPGGDSFTRRTDKDTIQTASATLVVDGHIIKRRRGKGINTYYCGEQEYKSFGSEVPEPIANILNIGDINFQGQHDPPFWFFKSPGEVSRELNSIVNLGLIDSTMAAIAAEVRKAKSEVSVYEDRLEAAQQKKDKLSWVVQAEEEFCAVETLYTELEETRLASRKLSDLLNRVGKLESDVEVLPDAISAMGIVLSAAENALEIRKQRKALESLLQRITDTEEEICQTQESVTREENDLRTQTKGKCPICGGDLTL